jgi:hypothetical protein
MLAMVANDDAGSLNASGVRTSIASMLAPTGAARFRAICVCVPPNRSAFHPVHSQAAP